jgi:putative component of membrane protein insertase Oxa1/YidC/SpoIIIJ protein YidD
VEIEAIKVVNAITDIGPYKSVVFDDPVTQAVIESYGGWPDVCEECSNREKTKWFKIHFKNTYRAYARQGIKKFGHLPGTIELQNRINGCEEFIEKPALIGKKENALMVLERGKEDKKKELVPSKNIKEKILQ